MAMRWTTVGWLSIQMYDHSGGFGSTQSTQPGFLGLGFTALVLNCGGTVWKQSTQPEFGFVSGAGFVAAPLNGGGTVW